MRAPSCSARPRWCGISWSCRPSSWWKTWWRTRPPILCDAAQIQQVILVLMVNAGEAMPKGGRLEVATEIDPEGESVRIRVRDTGMGIPADILSQIFDPFFTTKEEQQRTGLGLAVARSIVEQHGGEIAVESTPGAGHRVHGFAADSGAGGRRSER